MTHSAVSDQIPNDGNYKTGVQQNPHWLALNHGCSPASFSTDHCLVRSRSNQLKLSSRLDIFRPYPSVRSKVALNVTNLEKRRWEMDDGWERNTWILQCIILQWWWHYPIWFQQFNQDAAAASSCPHHEQNVSVDSVAAGADISACCSGC